MGPANLAWWLGACLIAAALTAYGYNVGSHYTFTHRLFRFPRIIESILIYTSTLSAFASPLSWAIHHHAHHKYTETEHDPHAPKRLRWRALFIINYHTDKTDLMQVRHLLRDPVQRFADSDLGFWIITLSWPLMMYLLGGVTALLYLWLLPLLYVLLVSIAFVFCHFGMHDARSRSNAVNSKLLSLLSLGDGNHLDHHRNVYAHGKAISFLALALGAKPRNGICA